MVSNDTCKMNFEGRYYTSCGLLVDVKPTNRQINGTAIKWRGVEVELSNRKHQPFEYDPERTFYWDENGKCVMAFRVAGPVKDFDLWQRQNPQEGV